MADETINEPENEPKKRKKRWKFVNKIKPRLHITSQEKKVPSEKDFLKKSGMTIDAYLYYIQQQMAIALADWTKRKFFQDIGESPLALEQHVIDVTDYESLGEYDVPIEDNEDYLRDFTRRNTTYQIPYPLDSDVYFNEQTKSALDKADKEENKDILKESEEFFRQISEKFVELAQTIVDLNEEFWDILYQDAINKGEGISESYSKLGLQAPVTAIAERTLKAQAAGIYNMDIAYKQLNLEHTSNPLAKGWSQLQQVNYFTTSTIIEAFKNSKAGLNTPQSVDYLMVSPYSRK